jgi:hypothetical protein
MSKEGEITFKLRCDWPAKEASLSIKGDTRIKDLRTQIGKLLDISSEIAQYFLINAAFGQDVIPLEDEDTTIQKLELRNGSTILIRAPVGVGGKSVVKRPKEEEEEESGEKKSVVQDKYKGFTTRNALGQITGPKSKLALEYVDIYANDIIKLPEFMKLPKDQLLSIVKRDTLNVEEGGLFEAVVAWAKVEAKKNDAGSDAESLRKVLADVLPHIRFPVMSTTDIASKVSPTGILDSQQTLELFTYLASKAGNKDTKPGSSLKFPTKERTGRKKPNWFSWDRSAMNYSLTLSQDGMTVTSTASQYQTIFGNAEIKTGTHEFEIYLSAVNAQTYACIIGVCPVSSKSMFANNMMIGYQNHIPGWCYSVCHPRKYHNKMEKYGKKCVSGETVKVRVDLDKKTIEFFVNGSSQGVAYTDVTGPVVPAVSLYAGNAVELRFPK